MAIESTPEGYTYATTDAEAGTAEVSKDNAFNSDAKLKYFKSLTSGAQADASAALQTLSAVRQETQQAKTAAQQSASSSSVSAAAANAAADTADRFGEDVEGLKVNAGWNAGSPNDEQNAAFLRDPNSESNAVLKAQIGQIPGVVDDDATDNTAAIQAAVDQGGRWMLPRTTGRYYVAGEVTLNVPGTELHLWGSPIRQGTGTLFRAVAPDLLIDGADSIGSTTPPDFTGMNTSWEGSITASRWCVVNIYASAHRLRIPWIRGRGMSAVVRSGGWDAATDTEATWRVQDVEIGTILCGMVEFGFAFKSTERVKVGRVIGTYGDTATMPRPPHLTYFAADIAGNGHVDPQLGDCVAHAGANGQAFQFKGITGGKAGRLVARDCYGVANIMDTVSLDVDRLESKGDKFADLSGGSVTVDNGTTASVVRIRETEITMTTDYRAFHVIANDGGDFGNITVHTDHQVAPASDQYDVILGGSNNKATVNVHNNPASPEAWTASAVWGTSPGLDLRIGTMTGVKAAVDARTSPSAIIRYDLAKITLHPTKAALSKLATTAVEGQRFVSDEGSLFVSGYAVGDLFDAKFGSLGYIATAITGQKWTQHAGLWTANDAGETGLHQAATGVASLDAGLANVRVEAEVKFASSEGLVFRLIDGSNYLAARLRPTAVEIENTGTVLATSAATQHVTNRWYTVAVDVFGNFVDVYVNGQKMLSHTLDNATVGTEHANATRHGMRVANTSGKFRRFRIKAI